MDFEPTEAVFAAPRDLSAVEPRVMRALTQMLSQVPRTVLAAPSIDARVGGPPRIPPDQPIDPLLQDLSGASRLNRQPGHLQ